MNNLSNTPVFSVTELSSALKRTLEASFGRVRVRGELCSVKHHSNGNYLYCDLKDGHAVLNGVNWKKSNLGIVPENGMDVICTGRITTYPMRSNYQLVIETMELAGEGALLKLLEDRKKKLAEEGLFDQERKRKLPYLPNVIGVITSPTGAVIQDILHRIEERCPRHVVVWPVAVQGPAAAQQITDAVNGFNALTTAERPDLIIIARGGGSIEDLMPFNEENVVRAVSASTIPVISAVGHETDTTLIDFVSDHRAPTPTAAAEKAVPVRSDILHGLEGRRQRLHLAMTRITERIHTIVISAQNILGRVPQLIEFYAQRLDDNSFRLQKAPEQSLRSHIMQWQHAAERLRFPYRQQDEQNKIDDKIKRLTQALERHIFANEQRVIKNAALLESFSYRNVLKRGFALLTNESGHAITSVQELSAGQSVKILLQNGEATANIKSVAVTEL